MIVKRVKRGTLSFDDIPVAGVFKAGDKVYMRLLTTAKDNVNAVDLEIGSTHTFDKIDQVQYLPDAHVVAP